MCYIVGAYLIILLTILTKTTALRTSEAHYSRTSLAMGMPVYGIADAVTRHLGVPISAKSEER